MTFWTTLRRSPYFWAGVFFACLALFMSFGFHAAGALPVPRHVPAITLTEGVCDDTKPTWHTTLSVTANVTGGTALISDANSPWKHAVPFTYTYNLDPRIERWTVRVYVTWPDGFVSETVSLTAHRPASGCQPAPTTTSPPLTALPPVPVPSTAPPVDSTVPVPTTSPSVTSEPQPEPAPPTSAQASPSTTAKLFLPVTGGESLLITGIAGAAVASGAMLVFVTRRRAS